MKNTTRILNLKKKTAQKNYLYYLFISQLTVFELSPLDAMPGGKICMWL